MLKRNFKDGELVKKGQLLFQIEPEKYEAAVAAAEADLLKARADQKNSTSDYERQKTLLAKDAVTEENFLFLTGSDFMRRRRSSSFN